jgi:hypothetical protein
MTRTADEIEAEVNAQVAAELARRKDKLREEIARKARVQADMAHLDKVNARHPIEDPPSPEEMAQRHRWADEALARDAEKAAANEARFRADEERREVARKNLPRMRVPGGEGLERRR